MTNAIQTHISIIIPTYNRPRKLQRAVRYYAKHDISVFVADGSPSPCTLPLEGDVSYFHLPEATLFERIIQVVNRTTTPYSCLAADDDFVSPAFLESACRIMEANSSVATVFGKCFAFEEKAPEKWREIYGNAKTIDQVGFKERFSGFFGDYYPIMYAPTRTHLLKEAFEDLSFLPLRYANIMELLHGALLAAAGDIIVLDDFYLARESAEVYMTGLLYPKVQEILKERPDLHETANTLIARWTGSSEMNLFSKYIMEPYNDCCSRMQKQSIPSKIKTLIRGLLGNERTDNLKKILPFLEKKPAFNSASDFAFEEALREIEQIILRSLEDEECASTKGESCCASS